MELTYEQWQRKQLRRSFSTVGWVLVIYYLIMNAAVILTAIVETIVRMMGKIAAGNTRDIMAAAEEATSSGWGYFLAAAVGLIVLLCWKKKRFWKEEIWSRGKPIKAGSFLGILCIFVGCQCVTQMVATTVELILNMFGLSILEGMNALSADGTNFSMFLYTGILAPIVEEILFRGLIQRTLMPYGKKFAILCTAFLFGIFHGNLIQAPFAFLVGLVLGYVAAEYSIGWAMVLHMVNNLLIADTLTRLTSGLPEIAAGLIIWAVIAGCFIAGIIVLIVKRKSVGAYLNRERMNGLYLKCFFSNAGMIVLMVIMGLSMVLTAFMLIGPI